MPGSGKSTIGKLLATKLNYAFLDLDAVIESSEGASIEAIFELKGEAYFRQIEAQALSNVVEKEGSLVIATGGGTPCYYNGLAFMQKNGTTIFINVPPNVLVERLKADRVRPLLKEGVKQKIQKLYKERLPIYLKSKFIIESNLKSESELVYKILVTIQPRCFRDKNS